MQRVGEEVGTPTLTRIPRLIVAAGLMFAALVVLAALTHTISLAAFFAESPNRRLGLPGAGIVLAGLLILVGAGILAVSLTRSRLTDSQLVLVGLGVVAVVRGAVVLALDAPLANDGRAYQELARWLAGGGCCFGDRPTGYPMLLAAAYRFLGDATWVNEAVNVVFAVLGGWLLHDLVRSAFGRATATFVLVAYAVMPGLALVTPLLLTDTVYATLLLGLCWAGLRMPGGGLSAAVIAGLILAVSQYVRPVAPALLPALAVIVLLYQRPMRRAVGMVSLLVLTFALAMLPAVAHNLLTHGDLSVSTSAYGGWSLFMGTNQRTNGRYSNGDAAIIADLPGDTLWERSEVAGSLGLERIGSDPVGFAGLTVRKFAVMWGTEEFAVVFAFRPEGPARGTMGGVDILAQLAYLSVAVGGAAGLLLALRRRGPPEAVLVLAVCLLLTEALVHTFLEVKPRYHALAEPLLLILAAGAVTAVEARLARRTVPPRIGSHPRTISP